VKFTGNTKIMEQSYSSAIVLTIPSPPHLYWHMKLHLLASWRWACVWGKIYCACVFLVIFRPVLSQLQSKPWGYSYLMMVLAPLDTSSLAIFTWPLVTASCSGVSFSNPGTFTRAPWSRSKEATST